MLENKERCKREEHLMVKTRKENAKCKQKTALQTLQIKAVCWWMMMSLVNTKSAKKDFGWMDWWETLIHERREERRRKNFNLLIFISFRKWNWSMSTCCLSIRKDGHGWRRQRERSQHRRELRVHKLSSVAHSSFYRMSPVD